MSKMEQTVDWLDFDNGCRITKYPMILPLIRMDLIKPPTTFSRLFEREGNTLETGLKAYY